MILAFLFLFFLSIAQAAPSKKAWTILHYNEADDNVLETSLIDNIREMIESISGRTPAPSFNLVIRYDGWTGQKVLPASLGKVTEVVDLVVNETGLHVLQRLGEQNMQDEAFMINFFVQYINKYPADNIMIIFADHGHALYGYGGDEHLGKGVSGRASSIFAIDLAARLKTVLSRTKVPKNKFSIVGFDACQMANIESLETFKDVSEYIIASEWNEPARGWDYNSLSTINNATTPLQLAEQIIRDFTAANTRIEVDPSTLGIFDLSKASAVLNALNNFVASSDAVSPSFLEDAVRARASERVPSDEGLCDLGSWVDEVLSTVSDNVELEELTYAGHLLRAAIDDLVLFYMSGPADDGTTGVAIWFPIDRDQSFGDSQYPRRMFPRFSRWYNWVQFFIDTPLVPVSKKPVLGQVTVKYDPFRNGILFSAELTYPHSVLEAYLWISYVDPRGERFGLLRLPARINTRALEGPAQEETGPGDRAPIGVFYNTTTRSGTGGTNTTSSGSRAATGFNKTGSRGVTGNSTRGISGNYTRGTNRSAVGPRDGFLEVFWDASLYTWPGNLISNWPWANVEEEESEDEYRSVKFALESLKAGELPDDCDVFSNWDVADGAWVLDSAQLFCEDGASFGKAEISVQNELEKDAIVGTLYPKRSQQDSSHSTGPSPLIWPLRVKRAPWNSTIPLTYYFSLQDLNRDSSSRPYTSSPTSLPSLISLKAQQPSTPSTPPSTPSRPPVGPSTTTSRGDGPEPVSGDEGGINLSGGQLAGIIIGCILGTFLITVIAAFVISGNKKPHQMDSDYYAM